MFLSSKRVFAGKHNLKQEPLCPYLSTEGGYRSMNAKQPDMAQTGAIPRIQGTGTIPRVTRPFARMHNVNVQAAMMQHLL